MVGGANSAGQAAMYFSKYARHKHDHLLRIQYPQRRARCIKRKQPTRGLSTFIVRMFSYTVSWYDCILCRFMLFIWFCIINVGLGQFYRMYHFVGQKAKAVIDDVV